MIGQVQFRDDDSGNDAGMSTFAVNGAARARPAGASIRPPQVLEGDVAAELFRHGETVFQVGKFVGVLFRSGEDSGELGVYCPTSRKLALFEPGTLVSVALEAGVGEP